MSPVLRIPWLQMGQSGQSVNQSPFSLPGLASFSSLSSSPSSPAAFIPASSALVHSSQPASQPSRYLLRTCLGTFHSFLDSTACFRFHSLPFSVLPAFLASLHSFLPPSPLNFELSSECDKEGPSGGAAANSLRGQRLPTLNRRTTKQTTDLGPSHRPSVPSSICFGFGVACSKQAFKTADF
ncbi:hypothetical protein LZ31DRAFT_22285 [Colletotrichum somersetense]|nr:hypothetical protein LZ31DRAFT_22285 [Colletotrichum somersetense]